MRTKFFPITMFAIIMGISGLTIVFQKANEIFGIPSIIGTTLLIIDIIIFFTIFSFYTNKLIRFKDEVKKDFNHPVKINFFATVSISFLLLSITFEHINKDISYYFFIIGTVLQTYFTLNTINFWINKNLELQHSNPAWFIPIVGNVIVPVAGASFVSTDFLMYYFALGVFFWIVLTSILINRIIFHHQLVTKFMPTLFIFIAPPSLAFIAYLKMNGMQYDMFASALYNLALFFTFLIFFMYKNFIGLKFFISWWAFTFPLTAVAIASMLAYNLTQIVVYKYLSVIFIIVATLVIITVSIQTIKHIIKGEVCVEE